MATEVCAIDHQDFTPPDRAVGAVARAVQGQPDNRAGATMLGKARQNVGVMVLDRDQGRIRAQQVPQEGGKTCGHVIGVHVVRDRSRSNVKQAAQVHGGLLEPDGGGSICQIADMRPHEG